MSQQIIKIPYKPRNWAKLLHDSKKRWSVLILHRRAGKSTAVLNHLQRDALLTPNSNFAYIAPTYKQAKRIAWDLIKQYSRVITGIEYNESELTVKYPNNAKLSLFGAENIDSLRGIALWGVAFDEYSQQPPNLFSEVISKCLADHLGYAIWLGTLKGKNHLFNLYENGKNKEDWLALWYDIEDSLKNEQGETINNLRQALEDDRKLVTQGIITEGEYLQEWYNNPNAAIKGAIYAKELSKTRADGRIKLVPYDPIIPVFTVWDLGIGDAMAVGFYQRTSNELRKIDYLETTGKSLTEVIAMVKNKPYVYGKHFAPHDIQVRELSSGKSRYEIAETLGIKFEIVPKLSLEDGINAGKLAFAKLWVDEKNCADWLNIISQYQYEWDDAKGMFKEKPLHNWASHGADEWRYAAIIEGEMKDNMSEYRPKPYKAQHEFEGSEMKSNHFLDEEKPKFRQRPHEKMYEFGG